MTGAQVELQTTSAQHSRGKHLQSGDVTRSREPLKRIDLLARLEFRERYRLEGPPR